MQVRDRAQVATRHRLGTLAVLLVEGDDAVLAPRLGGHHRDLRAGDELARVGGMRGPDRDADGSSHAADGIELRAGESLCEAPRELGRSAEVATHDHGELLAAHTADVVALPDGAA